MERRNCPNFLSLNKPKCRRALHWHLSTRASKCEINTTNSPSTSITGSPRKLAGSSTSVANLTRPDDDRGAASFRVTAAAGCCCNSVELLSRDAGIKMGSSESAATSMRSQEEDRSCSETFVGTGGRWESGRHIKKFSGSKTSGLYSDEKVRKLRLFSSSKLSRSNAASSQSNSSAAISRVRARRIRKGESPSAAGRGEEAVHIVVVAVHN